MTWRTVSSVVFLIALVVSASASAAPTTRPNVLFIVVDDLKPLLGCYGDPIVRTPNIDKLARRGVVMRNAYCQQAVCAPSRASVLTGCRPDTTGVYDLQTPLAKSRPDLRTLNGHFKQSGYVTISLGKIYHFGERDDPVGWSEPPWQPEQTFLRWALPENQSKKRANADDEQAAGRGPPFEAADVADDVYAEGEIATRAIATLNRVKDQPFFLAVGFYRPHLPFNCPKKYWDQYDESKLPLADNPDPPRDVPAIAMTNFGELRQYRGVPKNGPLPEPMARKLVHGYYACVSYIDAMVGRVIDELDRLGLADNTVIVLFGDHGWHLGDHGLWCKHTNFESATHAPLIFAGAGVPRESNINALCEFVDIYPTLCELARLDRPSQLEGQSLVPLFNDPTRAWSRAAFSQYPRGKQMGYSVRNDRYRFTRWQLADGSGPSLLELYDHQTDAEENVNLANRADQASVVHEMQQLLDAGPRAARAMK